MSPLTSAIVIGILILSVLGTLGIMRGAREADRNAEEMLKRERTKEGPSLRP